MTEQVFTLRNEPVDGITVKCRNLLKKELKNFGLTSITDDRVRTINIYLLLTQGCNLNCAYCYQSKTYKETPAVMTKKVIDDAMHFAMKTFDEKLLAFSLFGGEPFLRFDLIKYIAEKYPVFRYRIVTNGLVLNENPEIYDWVFKHRDQMNITISISSLKQKYGIDWVDKTTKLVDLVNHNSGDLHYVVDDPGNGDEDFNNITRLYQTADLVRVSGTRHFDKIKTTRNDIKSLFRRLADYLYFREGADPIWDKSTFDGGFSNNIYRYRKGLPLYDLPPTFCGCGGYLYLTVTHSGDIYPCDFFVSFPETKMGNIYDGLDPDTLYFKKMREWLDRVYEKCASCSYILGGDVRTCPRALCFAESYEVHKQPLVPTDNHCMASDIESDQFDYIAQKAIATGLDVVYHKRHKKQGIR